VQRLQTIHEREFAGHVDRTILVSADASIYEVSHQPLQVIARHEHQLARIAVAVEGTLTECGDGWCDEIGPGSVVFWAPGATHEDRFGTSPNRSVQVELSERMFAKVRCVFPMAATTCLGVELFDGAVRALLRELDSPDAATPIAAEGAIYALIARAQRILSSRTSSDLAVRRAIDYVSRNFHRQLTVAEIGAAAGLSSRTIRQRFQEELGFSPGEHLRRTRIETAAGDLATTDTPVGEIALACGFYDHAHLSREFHRRYGMTPRSYRNCHRSR